MRIVCLIVSLALVGIGPSSALGSDAGESPLISIPAQPLALALNSLAEQSRVEILYLAADVDGHVVESIDGEYGLPRVLDMLLDDTGLAYQFRSDQQIQVGSETQLDQLSASLSGGVGYTPAAATSIVVLAAQAQPTASASAPVLEEIIVSATRRSQSIQDIPYNISAITGDQLQSAGVDGLVELTRVVPGLAYADLGVRSAGVNNQLILRGLNANAQGSIGAFIENLTPAGVSTYMDDTPLFVNLRFNDLERVEILRGPQGTLYGAGSLGGTLRFIFNKPDPEKFAARIRTDLSQTNDADDLNYRVDGVVNVPLSEVAALRMSAGYEEFAGVTDANNLAVGGISNPQLADPTDPFGSPVATEPIEDTDAADQWYLRASLLWNLTESIQAQFTYRHQEDSADGFTYQTDSSVPGAEDRTHNQFFNSPLEREVDLFSLDLDFDLGFASLESSTSYTTNEAQNAGDLSGLAQINDIFAGGFAFGGYPTTNGSLVSFFVEDSETKAFTQEIRLVSQHDGKWDWVAGFFYQDIDSDRFEVISVPGFANYANTPGHPIPTQFGFPLSWANFIALGPGSVPQSAVDSEVFFTDGTQREIEDIAIFGELTYHVNDAWQITFGARIFWIDNKGELISTFPLFGAISAQDGMDPTGLNTASSQADTQDQIFKVNTSYRVNDALMPYFTWSQGFRRGGINSFPLTGFNAEDPSQITYKPDTVDNYEIGIKGVWLDKLSYTAAIYRIDWDDAQIAGTFLPSGFKAVFNANEARTEGVELEGDLQVTDQLRIFAGYAYTDAEYTQDFATPLGPSDFVPDAEASDGNRLPGVPEHMASWAFDYVHPVNIFGASEIHFRVDGSYRSSVVTASSSSAVQFEKLDGFSIWNASVAWDHDHWRVRAYVDNIGDEDGITQVVRDFEIARPAEAVDLMTRPRTFGLTVGYTF